MPVAGWLPDLVHPFAFTLLTAAAGPATWRAAVGASVFWWATDSIAELVQHPTPAGWLAAAAAQVPGLDTLAAYARQGTFDVADLLAIAAGAALAALLLRHGIAEETRDAH